jgi:fluoroacetyl-CoA thioesterase
MSEIAVGLRGQVLARVTADQTAAALGSGDVPAFGTPALVALVEAAAMNALAGRLAPDETTVGTRLEVAHLAATPVGAAVRAEAALVAVEGRKLTFTVIAYDDRGTIGEGRHERILLSRSRFLAKLAGAS